MTAWSDPAIRDLLGLAVDAWDSGDRRGLLLIRRLLSAECGRQFADAVCSALAAGAPLQTFDFLPSPTARRVAQVERSTDPPAQVAAPADPAAQVAAPADPPAQVERSADPPAQVAATVDPPAQVAAQAPDRGAQRGTAASESRRPEPGAAAPLPQEGYVTVGQVAEHFGVSVKAVYRWMASGRIQYERRPGGSYRIPAAQFFTS